MTRVMVKSSNADTASRWREFSGSIAGRRAMALIILGITATITTTVVQAYREYRAEITHINARFEIFESRTGRVWPPVSGIIRRGSLNLSCREY